MAQDLELDILYGDRHDLKLVNGDINLTASIQSVTTPDKLSITPNFSDLEVGKTYLIHFNTSAPEPAIINNIYTLRIDSVSPYEATLIQPDENGVILNGVLPTDSIIYFVNKDLKTVDSSAQILQKVIQKINTIKGEWFLDTQEGLPWFNDLLKSGVSKTLTFEEKRGIFEIYMKQLIVETEGVRALLSFNSELDRTNRNITFKYSIQTVFDNVEDGILGFDIPFS